MGHEVPDAANIAKSVPAAGSIANALKNPAHCPPLYQFMSCNTVARNSGNYLERRKIPETGQ
jgi:hypothetical protein